MKAEKKGRLVKWRLKREEIGEVKAEREVGWGNGGWKEEGGEMKDEREEGLGNGG
jgi:hypothetical protein